MYVDLIVGGLKDHLDVAREGVWAVSVCLTLVSLRTAFSERILYDVVCKVKLINITIE